VSGPGGSAAPPTADRNAIRAAALGRYLERAAEAAPRLVVEGRLRRTVGMAMEAEGCSAPVGGRCDVIAEDGRRVETEVVGFSGERLFLMPQGQMRGIVPNARVIPVAGQPEVTVGDDLLGRVLDGRGRPLDGGEPVERRTSVPLVGAPINPLDRQPIREPLDVGLRSINALLTIGRGQRMGLFAGSGVGKSMLLSMMTRNTSADVVVVGLIGERGREVKEFIEMTLGQDAMSKAVVVATPADETPLMRMQGAWLSAAIAEHFRDRGRNVLLLMDSLTRFAQLPELVERAGNGADGSGSITAIYTVLAEGDDQSDPIVDAARAILDGHIVLSRQLAEAGVYPAVDVEASVSRALSNITSGEQQALITRFRQVYACYREHRDLIAVGAYQRGSDPRVDEALRLWPAILDFLRQRHDEALSFGASLDALRRLLAQKAEGEAA